MFSLYNIFDATYDIRCWKLWLFFNYYFNVKDKNYLMLPFAIFTSGAWLIQITTFWPSLFFALKNFTGPKTIFSNWSSFDDHFEFRIDCQRYATIVIEVKLTHFQTLRQCFCFQSCFLSIVKVPIDKLSKNSQLFFDYLRWRCSYFITL